MPIHQSTASPAIGRCINMADAVPVANLSPLLLQGNDHETRQLLRERGREPAARRVKQAYDTGDEIRYQIDACLAEEEEEEASTIDEWMAPYLYHDDHLPNSGAWGDIFLALGFGLMFGVGVSSVSSWCDRGGRAICNDSQILSPT